MRNAYLLFLSFYFIFIYNFFFFGNHQFELLFSERQYINLKKGLFHRVTVGWHIEQAHIEAAELFCFYPIWLFYIILNLKGALSSHTVWHALTTEAQKYMHNIAAKLLFIKTYKVVNEALFLFNISNSRTDWDVIWELIKVTE